MPSTHNERLRQALAELPIFAGLPAPLRARVEALATLQELEKGETLWHAGDPADSLTVVVSGRVKIVRHADSGDMILEMFGPSETAGVVAVYNQIPYPATAIAMEPTLLLRLPRRDWFDLIDKDPGFARGMILQMTRLNMALTRKLAAMHGKRVGARVATLFLSLADRLGRQTAEGTEIPLALSRQEIAELVGTTVESAIRVMSRWNREGVLLTGSERFVIPDRDTLRAAANVEDEG
jgi:CRP/FNR family transcriptional regulator